MNEQKYLDLLQHVLDSGEERPDRTGVGTLSVFGYQMKLDIRTSVPLLTTKRVGWKSVIKELLWFLRGQTDAKILDAEGVKIWNDNSSREFLDRRGLNHYAEGDIGPSYGMSWRSFGAKYIDCKTDYKGQGFDQIQYILDLLKNDKYSRRMFVSSWNPAVLQEVALPCCHTNFQFYVNSKDELSCHMYQRSADCLLGVPFNIMSYSALVYLFAAMTGLKPGELIYSIGDCHIYKNHIDQVKLQLTRDIRPAPTLVVDPNVKNKTIDQLTIDDFTVANYNPHDAIKAPMAV